MTMGEVDKIRLSATSAIERSRTRRRPIGTKSVALRRQHLYKKLGRMLIAGGLVLIGAAVFGALIQPIGFIGQIGRASRRERVCQYVLISVVAGYLKKKKRQQTT